MAVSIPKIAPRVKTALQTYPKMRDNDNLLIAHLWAMEMRGKEQNPQFTATRAFFVDFSEGKYSSPEAIRRARQKIQEQRPELRGTSYQERQKKSRTIKSDIIETGAIANNTGQLDNGTDNHN